MYREKTSLFLRLKPFSAVPSTMKFTTPNKGYVVFLHLVSAFQQTFKQQQQKKTESRGLSFIFSLPAHS